MRFYVLGQLEVVSNTGPVSIRPKRLRALLAILLLNTTDIVPLDRIVDGIWPGTPPRSAVENVRTYVSQLRHLFGAGSERQCLESYPGGYRLTTEPEELDLLRFRMLGASGRRALQMGDHPNAAKLIGEAVQMWRGEPLPELELGAAMRAKVVALEEERWQVLHDWITARMALGESAGLVAPLRELLGERPLDERLWYSLVTALHTMGRTGEALSAFAQARETIVAELGIEPGPELRQAHAAVLGGYDIGTYAGRGESERAPLLMTSLGASQTVPHQLPPGPASFVGRRPERLAINHVAGAVEHNPAVASPVVLVSGPPGVGKTATAVAIGTGLADSFPDGELYVDLAGATSHPLDPSDALELLLAGLGITPEGLPELLERRTTLYRSLLVEHRMLVLLDDASDARQVAPLLVGTGRSLVIVTSRRWLAGVESLADLRLGPLGDREAMSMLEGVLGQSRVASEPDAATEVIERCSRLPAAIRIIAARLAARPQHSLRDVAERLRESGPLLDELSVGHLSLTRLFDTSYRNLDVESRRCFRAVGLLDPARLTAVGLGKLLHLPTRTADRALENLLYEGLLISGERQDDAGTYRMLNVLHAYAKKQLATEGISQEVDGRELSTSRPQSAPGPSLRDAASAFSAGCIRQESSHRSQ